MPTVLPVSEMQRNGAALVEEAQRTKEPIYLTKHGKASVVLVDAAAYDEAMTFQKALYEHERRVYEGIMKGHAEIESGLGIPLEEIEAEFDAKWGL